MKAEKLLYVFLALFMISGGAFLFVDEQLQQVCLITAGISIVIAGILKFYSKEENVAADDGVDTWADGLNLHIERVNEAGFVLRAQHITQEVKWPEIEFIVAYRTNKIPDSPLHVDLWSNNDVTYPLKSGMPGWDEFLRKLPDYLELENYDMLQTPPFTQNVMKSAVFALLYDVKGRKMEEVYRKYYAG